MLNLSFLELKFISFCSNTENLVFFDISITLNYGLTKNTFKYVCFYLNF